MVYEVWIEDEWTPDFVQPHRLAEYLREHLGKRIGIFSASTGVEKAEINGNEFRLLTAGGYDSFLANVLRGLPLRRI